MEVKMWISSIICVEYMICVYVQLFLNNIFGVFFIFCYIVIRQLYSVWNINVII